MINIGVIYFFFLNACNIGLIFMRKKPAITEIKNLGNLYTLFQKLFILFFIKFKYYL